MVCEGLCHQLSWKSNYRISRVLHVSYSAESSLKMHTATLKGSVISSCPLCVLWGHILEGERSDRLPEDKRSPVALL